jgi:hypothetical protein
VFPSPTLLTSISKTRASYLTIGPPHGRRAPNHACLSPVQRVTTPAAVLAGMRTSTNDGAALRHAHTVRANRAERKGRLRDLDRVIGQITNASRN